MEHELTLLVVTLTERRAQKLFRLRLVPRILILKDEGRVVFVRLHALERRHRTPRHLG